MNAFPRLFVALLICSIYVIPNNSYAKPQHRRPLAVDVQEIQPLTPRHLSLEPCSRPFDFEQARTLFTRFALGATDAQMRAAVAQGRDATIDAIQTLHEEPELEALEEQILCPSDSSCPTLGPNYRRWGYIEHVQRMWDIYSRSPYFGALSRFLADERMSVAFNDLTRDLNYHYEYVQLLRSTARSGNYRDYVHGLVRDGITAYYLDNIHNAGANGNQNLGRELMELATIGATDLDGTIRYGLNDVVNSARALAGWVSGNTYNDPIWRLVFDPTRAYHGQIQLFSGPNAVSFMGGTAESPTHLVNALFNYNNGMAIAEDLARDLWHSFINPYATPDALRALAGVIRANNFNLHPTMRTIMRSQAVCDPASYKSLIRPESYLMNGTARTLGWSVETHGHVNIFLSGEEYYQQPPSVFGWRERLNASGSGLQNRPYRFHNIVSGGGGLNSELSRNHTRSLAASWLANLPESMPPARATVLRVAETFGVVFTAEQLQEVETILSTVRQWAGNQLVIVPHAFDPAMPTDTDMGNFLLLLQFMVILPENAAM